MAGQCQPPSKSTSLSAQSFPLLLEDNSKQNRYERPEQQVPRVNFPYKRFKGVPAPSGHRKWGLSTEGEGKTWWAQEATLSARYSEVALFDGSACPCLGD